MGIPLILDLGCGNNKQPGAWGVDISTTADVDQHINLDKIPWALKDNYFFIVYALQVLEHLGNRVKTMEEIWRICRPGALVIISVPDGLCEGYVQDPTHRQPWSIGTFLYFCPGQFLSSQKMPPYNIKASFKVVDYHTRIKQKAPWGEQWYADDLRVVLRAIKEQE